MGQNYYIVVVGGVNRITEDIIKKLSAEFDDISRTSTRGKVLWVEASFRHDKVLENRLISRQHHCIRE